MSAETFVDVAIVGGGVSGVYCGWRLMQAGTTSSATARGVANASATGRPSVAVYECSDRIGGRLLSVTPPGMPHIRCELGGMRYTSTQPLIKGLVENKLKLATRPFPVSEPDNLAYLRRKHIRTKQLTDPHRVPYDLDWAERGRDPGSLLGFAINQIVPGATTTPPDKLLKLLENYQFEGKPLYEQGFWNLVARAITHEAYTLALQTSGYDTIGLNWNAVDTILLNFSDFGATVVYRALVKGYEEVPYTLCQQFQEQGGNVYMNHRLKSFDRETLPDGSAGLRLKFHADGTDSGAGPTVLTRKVILAMPRRSLELLEQTGPLFDPPDEKEKQRIQYLLQSVTPIPLFKMFICYPGPWWETVGVTQGQSVTDLPVRQCYYWGVEGRQPGADATNQNAVMLATYDDTLNVGFWAGLRNTEKEKLHDYQTGTNAFADREPESSGERAKWNNYKAPKAMVDEAHRQLKEMHGVAFAPPYYSAAFQDWGIDPFGGGVNFWNMHYKSWEIVPQMIQPLTDLPVYICGEAYSHGQGWVEGALQTAELVLHQGFGLQPPDWLGQEQPTNSARTTSA